jgi:hypothetical protein
MIKFKERERQKREREREKAVISNSLLDCTSRTDISI